MEKDTRNNEGGRESREGQSDGGNRGGQGGDM